MTMDDYLELLRLKNDDISSLKKAKFRYKISIAFLIVALTFYLLRIVSPFYIPVLVVATILLIIWFSYSDSIVDREREKTIIDLVNREFSKSIKQVKETKIKAEEKVSDLGRKKRMRNAILVSTITFIALLDMIRK